MSLLDENAWKGLLTDARTHYSWSPRPIDDATLHQLYALLRMAPTGLNCQPLRLAFVKSPEAKARLKPVLDAGNVEKAMTAPVTAIVAYDRDFHEKLGTLFPPHWPGAYGMVAALSPEAREGMGRLNATLQAGYLILTARGLGLDCGPMGGFNREALDAAFFPDGRWRCVLLVNLGYGDGASRFPRAPRLDFDEACQIL